MVPLAGISIIMKALFLNTKGVSAQLLAQSHLGDSETVCLNGLSHSAEPSSAVFLAVSFLLCHRLDQELKSSKTQS